MKKLIVQILFGRNKICTYNLHQNISLLPSLIESEAIMIPFWKFNGAKSLIIEKELQKKMNEGNVGNLNLNCKTTSKMVFCYQNCSDLLWEKNCSSDREKNLKFEAEGWEFAKILGSIEQFVQTVKGQNHFW